MCMKVDCEKCDKPTWKGCGKHIEQALKDVPEDERCKCPRESCALTTTTVEKKTEEITASSHEIKSEESPVKTEIKTEDAKVKVEQTKVKED